MYSLGLSHNYLAVLHYKMLLKTEIIGYKLVVIFTKKKLVVIQTLGKKQDNFKPLIKRAAFIL